MATRKSSIGASGSPSVAALLAKLEHPNKDGIVRLRALILQLDPRIQEDVKWNAPSFLIEDHFATFKLHPPTSIRLVLHTGAKSKGNTRCFRVDDPDGLLTWPASDRCVLTLATDAEMTLRESAVRRILRQWIAQL